MFSIRYLLSNSNFKSSWPYKSIRWLHQTDGAHQIVRAQVSKELDMTTSLYKDIVPRIGLEIHAQLKITSKLFSQGGNSKCSPPNSQLDLFDISLPGTLPKLNREALRLAILSSLGLNCRIQDTIHFDRKNYFYTDMPAGYQITQYNKPIAKDGFVEFIATTYHNSVIAHAQKYDLTKELYFDERNLLEDFEPYLKCSRIKQIQLEQDSAKSLHHYSKDSQAELYSLVDYNRSGSGLIEIVFEPDLTNHHEASSLIRELVQVLKTLDTCDCELEEGSLRVDANVSIESILGHKVLNSGKVELKNLNSIRSVNRGISVEIKRQAELIREGKSVVQESRTYDTKSHQTVSLRLKEDAIDYRYVPDPNIPFFRIDDDFVYESAKDLPQNLPHNLRERLLSEYNLDLIYVVELLDEPGLCDYMQAIMKTKPNYDANEVADFLIYVVANLKRIADSPIEVNFDNKSEFMKRLGIDKMQAIFDTVAGGDINFTIAYRIIKHIFVTGDGSDPKKMIQDQDWYQINDPARVRELCSSVIKSMKSISKNYAKKGEKRHLRMLLEKVYELSDDKINVKRAVQSFDDQLRQ